MRSQCHFIDAYKEPHRHYHTLGHITECLRELREVAHHVTKPQDLWMALWFHDAVYSVGAAAALNEERSAAMARNWIQNEDSQRTVTRLILVTKHSPLYPPLTTDECLMCDIDLAILGAPPDIFDAYCRNIRKEYSHVIDTDYVPARAKILERFLLRDRIYHTEYFRCKYERQARLNIIRELDNIVKLLLP